VARELPGAWFDRAEESHPVRYLSVAGDVRLDDPDVTATARRLAPSAYRNSTGRSADRGARCQAKLNFAPHCGDRRCNEPKD
jgi:hypothetical protein